MSTPAGFLLPSSRQPPSATVAITATDYGVAGDGSTDDTVAIQSYVNDLMKAAGAGGQNVIGRFPDRQYLTSAPILIGGANAKGICIRGEGGPGSTMGGAGSGSGFTVGGSTGTNHGYITPGATFMPSANWSAAGYNDSAVFLVDGSLGGAAQRITIERFNINGDLAGNVKIHGVEFFGNVGASQVRDFNITTLYNGSSHGIFLAEDGSANDPDGCSALNGLIQFVGGDGIHGSWGDGTIRSVHTQQIGHYGFWISDVGLTGGSGGNIRITDCRGDLSGLSGTGDGIHIQVGCGQFMGMVNLVNFSTQRNMQNGMNIVNTAGTETCPVHATGCTFQGDGIDGTSSGIRLAGPVGASLVNCSVHTNHNTEGDTHNYPVNGLTVTQGGTGASATFASVIGGLITARTTPRNIVNAPVTATADYLYATIAEPNSWSTGATVSRQQGAAL